MEWYDLTPRRTPSLRGLSKKRKALIGLVVLTGLAMLVTLCVYLWASITNRGTLTLSFETAFGLSSLAFSVFLGAILGSPDQYPALHMA
jgi:hypothetical protein